MLSFKNNSAYERWWEARKIWDKLVNGSRHFSAQIIRFVEKSLQAIL
jgi:putative membrane protein